MQQSSMEFPAVRPFSLSIRHVKMQEAAEQNVRQHHLHSECEIYINLSGDVSFMVEEKIYPIRPGDAILTRPYEYHHCIYHSDAPHEHFWILFSAEGNEALFPLFFCRERGEENRIVLPREEQTRMFGHCRALLAGEGGLLARYQHFFALLSLLRTGTAAEEESAQVPEELRRVLEYINVNYAGPIAVGALAEMAFVSEHAGTPLSAIPRRFALCVHHGKALDLLFAPAAARRERCGGLRAQRLFRLLAIHRKIPPQIWRDATPIHSLEKPARWPRIAAYCPA